MPLDSLASSHMGRIELQKTVYTSSSQESLERSESTSGVELILVEHDDLEHTDKRTPTTLQALLEKFPNLNLSGLIYQTSTFKTSLSGCNVVSTGYYKSLDGTESKVAVKTLYVRITTDEEFHKVFQPAYFRIKSAMLSGMPIESRLCQELSHKLYIWSSLRHPNILPLHGFYLEDDVHPSLVSEWMESGTVLMYLEAHPEADLLPIVSGIAEGVNYLHMKDISHSEINPNNILMDALGQPRLCAFGICRMLAESATCSSSTYLDTYYDRYASKELFSGGFNAYSKESDVWAFGMTVLTLLTREPPYSHIRNDIQAIYAISQGSLPFPPTGLESWSVQNQNLWHMCNFCWYEPAKRPLMQNIVCELEKANPILRRDERKRSENVGGPAPATLEAVLARRSDLDLTGMVYSISPVQQNHGGYSDIFTGYCKSTSGVELKVAIKKLRVQIKEEIKFEKGLAKELYIWSKLDHPRILPLVGFFLENSNYPHLVSLWMENGTARKYLEALPDADLLHLTIGIAKGVNYLHNNGVVHSDIKPDNVLISDSGEPLLCDFGVSRMLATSSTFQFSISSPAGIRGTIRYMSKELLGDADHADQEPAPHSVESDIWAFGMTILALLTRKSPYSHLRTDHQVFFAIIRGSLPSRPSDFESWSVQNQILWHMCNLCWVEPAKRAPMPPIIRGLESMHLRFGSEPRPPLNPNDAYDHVSRFHYQFDIS